eukprot:UN31522
MAEAGQSRVWSIGGNSYNFTEWMDKHPGGSTILYTTEGSDTDLMPLFKSYHRFSKQQDYIYAQLEKYKIENPKKTPVPKLDVSYEFTDKLEEIVKREYFDKNNYSIKASYLHIIKCALAWIGWLLLLVNTFILPEPIISTYISAFLSAFCVCMVGFCMMHDASHYGI